MIDDEMLALQARVRAEREAEATNTTSHMAASAPHQESYDNPDTPLKQCRRCKNQLPARLEYFAKDSRRDDLLCIYCKPCMAGMQKKSRDKRTARMQFLDLQDKVHTAARQSGKIEYHEVQDFLDYIRPDDID